MDVYGRDINKNSNGKSSGVSPKVPSGYYLLDLLASGYGKTYAKIILKDSAGGFSSSHGADQSMVSPDWDEEVWGSV